MAFSVPAMRVLTAFMLLMSVIPYRLSTAKVRMPIPAPKDPVYRNDDLEQEVADDTDMEVRLRQISVDFLAEGENYCGKQQQPRSERLEHL